MPVIRITPRSVDKAAVRQTLAEALPDLEIGDFGVHTSVAESKWAGTLVMVMKDRVQTSPSIPSFGMLALGLLILLLGGVVIPGVIYGVKVVPRQKAVQARVLEALERELSPRIQRG